MREITIPISEETIRSLHVGEPVELSGIMLTGRDAVHKWMRRRHDEYRDAIANARKLLERAAYVQAELLCRLHDEEDYRRTGVIARSTDYRAEAKAVLEDIPPPDSERSEDAAMLGLATDELVRAS